MNELINHSPSTVILVWDWINIEQEAFNNSVKSMTTITNQRPWLDAL